MKVLRFLAKVAFCLAVCGSLAGADSLQLRNGRHLQGKYIGGTTTVLGFMSGGAVDYFPTTEVLVLIFDNNNDPTLGGSQTSPMKGKPEVQASGISRIKASRSSRNRAGQPKLRLAVASTSRD